MRTLVLFCGLLLALPAAAKTKKRAGSLRVTSDGSEALVVRLDGAEAGTTPLTLPDVAPGKHVLEVGLADTTIYQATILVKAGARTTVKVLMPPPEEATDGTGGVTLGYGHGPKHPGHVQIGAPTSSGGLDKVVIRRYIRRNLNKIAYCYEKELAAKPDLSGVVTATFTIGGEGKVTASSAKGMDDNVATCIADLIRAIEFPKPEGGGEVNVTSYPFSFRPQTSE